MKTICSFICLFICSMTYSQVHLGNPSDKELLESHRRIDSIERNRRDWSPDGFTKEELLMSSSNANGATQITYFDMNFVTDKIDNVVERKLGWKMEQNHYKQMVNNLIIETFTQTGAFNGNEKPSRVNVKYVFFKNHNGNMIIKDFQMSGSWSMLVDFFVTFWPTTIHLNPDANKIASRSFLMDKITISPISINKTGTISITNIQIKNIADYENHLSNAITSILKGKNSIQPSVIEAPTPNEIKKSETYQTFYVHSDNVLLRDSFDQEYTPIGILHKGSIVHALGENKNSLKYIHVKVVFKENNNGLDGWAVGWIMKKYTTTSIIENNIEGEKFENIDLVKYAGDSRYDPNRNIWKKYPYPKYKGGKK